MSKTLLTRDYNEQELIDFVKYLLIQVEDNCHSITSLSSFHRRKRGVTLFYETSFMQSPPNSSGREPKGLHPNLNLQLSNCPRLGHKLTLTSSMNVKDLNANYKERS